MKAIIELDKENYKYCEPGRAKDIINEVLGEEVILSEEIPPQRPRVRRFIGGDDLHQKLQAKAAELGYAGMRSMILGEINKVVIVPSTIIKKRPQKVITQEELDARKQRLKEYHQRYYEKNKKKILARQRIYSKRFYDKNYGKREIIVYNIPQDLANIVEECGIGYAPFIRKAVNELLGEELL